MTQSYGTEWSYTCDYIKITIRTIVPHVSNNHSAAVEQSKCRQF